MDIGTEESRLKAKIDWTDERLYRINAAGGNREYWGSTWAEGDGWQELEKSLAKLRAELIELKNTPAYLVYISETPIDVLNSELAKTGWHLHRDTCGIPVPRLNWLYEHYDWSTTSTVGDVTRQGTVIDGYDLGYCLVVVGVGDGRFNRSKAPVWCRVYRKIN